MIHPPSHFRKLAPVLAAGYGLGWLACGQGFLPNAAAQTKETSSTAITSSQPAPAVDQTLATQMVDTSTKSRHLAPHDTFYLLTYVSARTNDGVEGFDPGQEVHLVEVRRATHTLVVSDGHAQVEVQPSQLTNDMDIAALVRQKDEASQARIAAHMQAERDAYAKFERDAADATTKDLAQRRKEQQKQADETGATEQPRVAQTAQPATDPTAGNGYYGDGGYGYGNPYSYFSGPSVVVVPRNSAAPAVPSGAAPAAASRPVNPATVGTAGRPPR